jgi:hypothetical protein
MERSRFRGGILALSTGCTTLAVALSRFGLAFSPVHGVVIGAGAALSALGLWNVFTARID